MLITTTSVRDKPLPVRGCSLVYIAISIDSTLLRYLALDNLRCQKLISVI